MGCAASSDVATTSRCSLLASYDYELTVLVDALRRYLEKHNAKVSAKLVAGAAKQRGGRFGGGGRTRVPSSLCGWVRQLVSIRGNSESPFPLPVGARPSFADLSGWFEHHCNSATPEACATRLSRTVRPFRAAA
jgi:hypothetical protein